MPPKAVSAKEKAKTYAKTLLTKSSNKLAGLVADEKCSLEELESAMEDFDKKLSEYDEKQMEASLEIEVEEDLIADAEAGIDYRDKILIPRAPATVLFKKLSPKETDGESVKTTPTEQAAHMGGKLPKLELETFDGGADGFIKWTPWWEHYDSVIHSNERMTEVVKFTYLRSILTGEALQCIAGLSLTTANYRVAIDQLKERYARPEKIRFAHIHELLNLVLENSSSVALYKMYNSLVSHIRSLEHLELKKDQYGVILVPLILSRLPEDMKLEWAREGGDGASTGGDTDTPVVPKEADLDFLLTFLKSEIERRDRSNSLKNPFAPSSSSHRSSGSALLTCGADTNSCKICGGNHKEYRCPDLLGLPKADRKSLVQEKRLCHRCLRHWSKCDTCSFKCKTCGGDHNSLLCHKQESVKKKKGKKHKVPSNVQTQSQAASNVTQSQSSTEQDHNFNSP